MEFVLFIPAFVWSNWQTLGKNAARRESQGRVSTQGLSKKNEE
jgi:hypothetical protein